MNFLMDFVCNSIMQFLNMNFVDEKNQFAMLKGWAWDRKMPHIKRFPGRDGDPPSNLSS